MRRWVILTRLLLVLVAGGFDYGVPDTSFSASRVDDLQLYGANPGGDRPDDSYTLGEQIYPTDLEHLSPAQDPASRIAIWQHGYAKAANALVGLTTPPVLFTERDLSLMGKSRETPSVPVLIIPSGGLADATGTEREGFDRYVRSGGTLFVFCQPFGEDYGKLPFAPEGGALEGYGWLEDQSVLLHAATPVSGWKPLTAFKSGSANLNVDGFFTALPKGSSALLRHAVSGQPVMVYYRLGKGRVIATTLFSDWAFLHQRATREEVELVQQVIAWAVTPNRQGEIDRGGDGSRASLPPLSFAVLSDHEVYTVGGSAVFTLVVWNHGNQDRWVSVFYEGQGHKLQVLPRRSSRITYTTRVNSSHRLWVYFHDEKERYLSTLTRGVQVVFTSPVELSLRQETITPAAGNTAVPMMQYAVNVSGTKEAPRDVRVEVKVFDPEHRIIHSEAWLQGLSGPKGAGRTIRFRLPPEAIGGSYLVRGTVQGADGEHLGSESTTFELPLSFISVNPVLPDRIDTQRKVPISFSLRNAGPVSVEKGELSVQWKDPAGRTFYEAGLPFSLRSGEQSSLQFKVPFSEILLGDYTLTVKQSDETRRAVPVPVDLSNVIVTKVLFNQNRYMARDPVELTIKLSNQGPFDMQRLHVLCNIPDFSFQESQEVGLGPQDETTVPYRLRVPEDVREGSHEIKVTLTSGGSSSSETFALEIPASALSVVSYQPRYRMGERIQLTLSNRGGVDTDAEIHLTLRDAKSHIAVASEQTLPIAAGAEVPLYLPLTPGVVVGRYTLNIELQDRRSKTRETAVQSVQIIR